MGESGTMFTVLRMYADDNIASMYATSMHSDSGYLVTDSSGNASYGGYLTWDDHPTLAQAQGVQDQEAAQWLRALRLRLRPGVECFGRTLPVTVLCSRGVFGVVGDSQSQSQSRSETGSLLVRMWLKAELTLHRRGRPDCFGNQE